MTEKTIILPPNSGDGHDVNYKLTVMIPKRRYLSYLRERWWVAVMFVAAGLGTILAYEILRSETFESFAQIHMVGQVQLNNMFSEDSQNYFGTQIELFKSPRLRNAALEKAQIVLKPDEKPPKLDVVRPLATAFLQLRTTDPDPTAAQRYLQGLIDAYLEYDKATRRSASEEIVDSLTSELGKRDAELKAEQDKWADFQKTNNVAVLEGEGKSAGLYLADLNMQLAKLRLERKLLEQGLSPRAAGIAVDEAHLDTVAATNLLAAKEPNLTATAATNLTAVTGTSLAAPQTNRVARLTEESSGTMQTFEKNPLISALNASLNGARLDLSVLISQRGRLTNSFSETHPAVKALDSSIAAMKDRVAFLERQSQAQPGLELKELEKREALMEAALPELEAKVKGINDRLAESQRLKDSIARAQTQNDHLRATLSTVDLNKNVAQQRWSVLQPATPGKPAERYVALRIVLGVLTGLFLGPGLIFLWYLLDDRFVSVRDIKEQFGEMVLGLVPQIRVPRSNPQQALLGEGDQRRPYAESYRHLRSALLLSSSNEGRPQTLLITSAAPAEGKTTIAINLARALARSGLRVALVDVDFQGRGFERMLGAVPKVGILDFLRGEASSTSIVHPTEIPSLTVVPTGTRAEHSEGLFLRPALKDLLAELRKDRDFVIFDTPPILAADDAALLVPYSDAVVLVMRPFYTRSRLVRQTLDMLYQRKAKRVTMILNRARKDDLEGHYYARNG